ncbi:hypothetical protein GGI35DRAFT_59665 [Trichoderma velutinum]
MPSSCSVYTPDCALPVRQRFPRLGFCLGFCLGFRHATTSDGPRSHTSRSPSIAVSHMAKVQNRATEKHASSGCFRSLSHVYACNWALGATNRHTAIMARGRGPTERMAIGLDGTREQL